MEDKKYLVTFVYANTDGDVENGMCEPDFNFLMVEATDEQDAKEQVKAIFEWGGVRGGRSFYELGGITDVHEATEEEIAEYYGEEDDIFEPTAEDLREWQASSCGMDYYGRFM